MIGNKKKQNQKGFTLMEILVVLGIFILISTLIIDVYLLSLNAQQQTFKRQNAASSLRFISENITRNIRSSMVDYSMPYDSDTDFGIVDDEDQLYLIDESGNSLHYYQFGGELYLSTNGQAAKMTNLEEVAIVKLAFYINPTLNPFSSERCNEDSDCSQASSGCSFQKLCVGGSNDGDACSSDANCSGGFCPEVAEVGFCGCSNDNQCLQTGHCDLVSGSQTENLCQPLDIQPHVTVVIGLESQSPKIIERKRIYLQTTATSRIYAR